MGTKDMKQPRGRVPPSQISPERRIQMMVRGAQKNRASGASAGNNQPIHTFAKVAHPAPPSPSPQIEPRISLLKIFPPEFRACYLILTALTVLLAMISTLHVIRFLLLLFLAMVVTEFLLCSSPVAASTLETATRCVLSSGSSSDTTLAQFPNGEVQDFCVRKLQVSPQPEAARYQSRSSPNPSPTVSQDARTAGQPSGARPNVSFATPSGPRSGGTVETEPIGVFASIPAIPGSCTPKAPVPGTPARHFSAPSGSLARLSRISETLSPALQMPHSGAPFAGQTAHTATSVPLGQGFAGSGTAAHASPSQGALVQKGAARCRPEKLDEENFPPCKGCVRSAMAGKSNGRCHKALFGTRCWKCASGHKCEPLNIKVIPFCQAFFRHMGDGRAVRTKYLVALRVAFEIYDNDEENVDND